MSWQFNNKEPVFVQISKRLQLDIFDGRYLPDEQIPSVRQLAVEASVNPNTMQKALTVLEEMGLLYSRGTVGRFVTSDAEIIERARCAMKKEAVRDIMEQARAFNITADELIRYIKEDDDYERTGIKV